MRSLRTAPCHDRLKALGVVFGQKFGWKRSNWLAPEGMELVQVPSSRCFELAQGFSHDLDIFLRVMIVTIPFQNNDPEILLCQKFCQDVPALLGACGRYVYRQEDKQLLGVGMTEQIEHSSAHLFAGSRLYLDGNVLPYSSIDSRWMRGAIVDFDRGSV